MTSVIDTALKRKLEAGHRTGGAWRQLCSPIAAEHPEVAAAIAAV